MEKSLNQRTVFSSQCQDAGIFKIHPEDRAVLEIITNYLQHISLLIIPTQEISLRIELQQSCDSLHTN